jgi:putative membrane protein
MQHLAKLIAAASFCAAGQASHVSAADGSAEYLARAAESNLFEVRISEIALTRVSDQYVREFAEIMIKDHLESAQDLTDLAGDARLEVTMPDIEAHHAAIIEKLKSTESSDFDQMFLDVQAEAHAEALDLHKNYAETGDNEALRAYAEETAEVTEHHLGMLAKLKGN